MSGSAPRWTARHLRRWRGEIQQPAFPFMSARSKLERQRLQQFNELPLPSGLLEAFDLVDAIDRHHPEARGCHPAGILRPPARANRSTLTHEG
jgi:hypothetical protein